VRIWDTSSGERLLVFTAHGDGVAAGLFPGTLDVAYSPDGTRLVTVGADGLAKVWDAGRWTTDHVTDEPHR
jgi:WD40 repeat protein